MPRHPLDHMSFSCKSCTSPPAPKTRCGSIMVGDIYCISESAYNPYLEFVDEAHRDRLTRQLRGAASMRTFNTTSASNADRGPRPCVVTEILNPSDNTVKLCLLATFNNSPLSNIGEELREFLVPIHSVRSPESVKALPHLHTCPTWDAPSNHQYIILLPIIRRLTNPQRWIHASGWKQKAGYFLEKKSLSRLDYLLLMKTKHWHERNSGDIPGAQARLKAALLAQKEAHKTPEYSEFATTEESSSTLALSAKLKLNYKFDQGSCRSGMSRVSKIPTVPSILEARC